MPLTRRRFVALLRCAPAQLDARSEEHTSELQPQSNLVCRLLLEKKKKIYTTHRNSTHLNPKPTQTSTAIFGAQTTLHPSTSNSARATTSSACNQNSYTRINAAA